MSEETPKTHEEQDSQHKMSGSSLLTLGIVGSLLLGAIIVGGIGYAGASKGPESPFTIAAATFFRMPVAKVNGTKVLYADYKEDIDTLNNFYAKVGGAETAPTPDVLSAQVLSRQIANEIVRSIAADLSVSVTDQQVEDAKASLFAQFASEDEARADLLDKYGWTIETYIEKVVRPILLEQNVSEAFQISQVEEHAKYQTGEEIKGSHILLQVPEEKTRADIKKLAEDILTKIKNGENFEELAKQYGSDGTKEQGGDLGWFGRGVMVPAFEEALFALKDGELGNTLVETEFGYHIVKRTGTRKAKDFNAFMSDMLKNADIKTYMGLVNPLEAMFAETAVPQEDVQVETLPEETIEAQQ